jgi:AraC family transcriptional regulator of adaptative response/methylated-DNA-[protein]-cysteine methyltransferase
VHEYEEARVLRADWIDTPLGPMVALATERALCMLEFVSRPEIEQEMSDLRSHFDAGVIPGSSGVIDRVRIELGEYFAGARSQFTVELETPGTAFQRKTWGALCEIPCGETISYAQLAERVGSEGAQRAVGRANGQNRIAIVVPCHRVIRTGGALGGYAGGLWRKRRLLDHEAAHWGSGRPGGAHPALFAD